MVLSRFLAARRDASAVSPPIVTSADREGLVDEPAVPPKLALRVLPCERASEVAKTASAIVGVILKLPPVQQALAGRQLRSRYLEALVGRTRS